WRTTRREHRTRAFASRQIARLTRPLAGHVATIAVHAVVRLALGIALALASVVDLAAASRDARSAAAIPVSRTARRTGLAVGRALERRARHGTRRHAIVRAVARRARHGLILDRIARTGGARSSILVLAARAGAVAGAVGSAA